MYFFINYKVLLLFQNSLNLPTFIIPQYSSTYLPTPTTLRHSPMSFQHFCIPTFFRQPPINLTIPTYYLHFRHFSAYIYPYHLPTPTVLAVSTYLHLLLRPTPSTLHHPYLPTLPAIPAYLHLLFRHFSTYLHLLLQQSLTYLHLLFRQSKPPKCPSDMYHYLART